MESYEQLKILVTPDRHPVGVWNIAFNFIVIAILNLIDWKQLLVFTWRSVTFYEIISSTELLLTRYTCRN